MPNGGSAAPLRDLPKAAGRFAAALSRADRRQQAATLVGLCRPDRSDLQLLNALKWSWRLETHRTAQGRILFIERADHRAVFQVALDFWVSPVPKGTGPSSLPSPPEVFLERPRLLRVATAETLPIYAPSQHRQADETVLLDLGEGGVLAVWRPEILLGRLHAKLWLDGRRLDPPKDQWPIAPFMELVRQLGDWLSGEAPTVWVPLDHASDDTLVRVIGEILQARQRTAAAFVEAASVDNPSWLGSLQADHVLARMQADLLLRLDTEGGLSGSSDNKTVTLEAALRFDESPDPTRPGQGKVTLQPPSFLASGEVLSGLLDALRTDASNWSRRGLPAGVLRRVLSGAAVENSGIVAFRLERLWSRERWVLFLPRNAERSHWLVLKAKFKRRSSEDENATAVPESVVGGRDVLHHHAAGNGTGFLDDEVIEAFLKLITALHRFSKATS